MKKSATLDLRRLRTSRVPGMPYAIVRAAPEHIYLSEDSGNGSRIRVEWSIPQPFGTGPRITTRIPGMPDVVVPASTPEYVDPCYQWGDRMGIGTKRPITQCLWTIPFIPNDSEFVR